ncbi:hypothetical protein LINPERPRIM_LOCUS9437 [Linum perenne]
MPILILVSIATRKEKCWDFCVKGQIHSDRFLLVGSVNRSRRLTLFFFLLL